MAIILSCEHATNAVPPEYAQLFSAPEAQAALQSHEGWDIGARKLAALFRPLAPDGLLAGQITRLLLDLNRSPKNPVRWSRFTGSLDEVARARLHCTYFEPYLDTLSSAVVSLIGRQGEALHISIHSFTRMFKGTRRTTDIGVLFDPDRPTEATIALAWIKALSTAFPHLRVEANEPYRGTDDGLTTLLRAKFPPATYSGLELEICNDLISSLLTSPHGGRLSDCLEASRD